MHGSSTTYPIMQAIHVASFDNNMLTIKDIYLHLNTVALVPALQCRTCHIVYTSVMH